LLSNRLTTFEHSSRQPRSRRFWPATQHVIWGLGGSLLMYQSTLLAQGVDNKIEKSTDCQRNFYIDTKSADQALIEFAKQANLTIVFPFNKVKTSVANSLYGHYCTTQAIALLLHDTGLIAQFNHSGALTIRTLADVQASQQQSIFANIIKLFSDEDENLMTFPEQQEPAFELIVVKGIRASTQRAMDIKQDSHEVVDVIKAEDIGKFPDLNLAESLQRITGVSIDRSEGEGQFVTVRGFGPQFNTVLTNGRRLATDNQGREFSFDTLASELVSGVMVYKTFSASMQSGGIGSAIDIETARPFSENGFKVAGSVKAMFDTNSEETTPQGTVLLSHSNEQFGWLISLSHQQRKARINEAQTDGWLLNTNIPPEQLISTSDNIFVPRNYDQRVRFDQRTRTGGTLVLQYRPNPDLEVSLDYLSSSFVVETQSTSMGHWFTSSNIENAVTDENGTVIEFQQSVGHATDFHARTFDRPSKIGAVGVNIDWQVSHSLGFEVDLSLSDASIKDTKGAANALSLIGYLNRSKFDHTADTILPSISGFATPDPTILDADGAMTGVSDYLDPANGRSHVMLRRGWNIRDDFDQFRFDGVWAADGQLLQSISFGLMLTHQAKQNERWDNEYNSVHCTFCGYFNEPDLPDNLQQVFRAGDGFLKGISGYQGVPNAWLQHDGETLFNFLESVSGLSFDAVKRNNSFAVEENVAAVYMQFEFSTRLAERELNIKSGIRYENTQIDVNGIEADLLALNILDQTELGQVTAEPRNIEQRLEYGNWLPSLTARWQLTPDLVTRFAVSRSLTRPTMSQMSPSLTLNATRQGGDLRASSGNPGLKPFESANIDVAVEWYFEPSSYLSASYFRKKVNHFIVSETSEISINEVTDPSTGNDPLHPDSADTLAIFHLTQPVNDETATVNGWEFAIQHDFSSGFGILANTTLVDSNAQLDRDDINQKFALTGLSDSRNLIVYYEQGPAQIRFAWNQRDGFLQSLLQIQGGEPTFVRRYQQLDVSANYALSENLSVFFDGVNLSKENVYKHGRYSNQLLLAQQPGARYTVGIRGSF
jgi:iron complex outermembrane receptor protein